MADPQEDLRATSESIQDDAQRLKDLEALRNALDPSDPRFRDLSEEIEALVRGISRLAMAERELSQEIRDR